MQRNQNKAKPPQWKLDRLRRGNIFASFLNSFIFFFKKGATLPRGHIYNDRAKNAMSKLIDCQQEAKRLQLFDSTDIPPKPIRSYGSRGSLGQFSYPSDQLYSIPDGYMSSPERGTRAYEEPYYTQYGSRGSSITPIIDEESR